VRASVEPRVDVWASAQARRGQSTRSGALIAVRNAKVRTRPSSRGFATDAIAMMDADEGSDEGQLREPEDGNRLAGDLTETSAYCERGHARGGTGATTPATAPGPHNFADGAGRRMGWSAGGEHGGGVGTNVVVIEWSFVCTDRGRPHPGLQNGRTPRTGRRKFFSTSVLRLR